MSSPTQRTLKRLRDAGYRAQVVEKWIPQARRRQDLYGVADVLAIRAGETLAVQTTSASNLAARVKKIEDSDALADMREAGWRVECDGWRKNAAGRWVCKTVDVS